MHLVPRPACNLGANKMFPWLSSFRIDGRVQERTDDMRGMKDK